MKARQVSVTAYQLRSIKCSNSAALNWPKNNFLINLPVKITSTRDCNRKLVDYHERGEISTWRYITAMLGFDLVM